MKEIIIILLIGISLSIDAFSFSLTISSLNLFKNKYLFPIFVGIFHFLMPLLGTIINENIVSLIVNNTNFITGIVLILLSISILIDNNKQKKEKYEKISLIGFSLAVSIDSLSVGIGLMGITNKKILASTVFAICSFTFTILGLFLGNKLKNTDSKLLNYLAILILLIIGISYICK